MIKCYDKVGRQHALPAAPAPASSLVSLTKLRQPALVYYSHACSAVSSLTPRALATRTSLS